MQPRRRVIHMRRPIEQYDERAPLSNEERKQETEIIMQLFKLWHLTNAESATLLGLSPNTATSINNYNTGKAALPKNRDTQDRIGHLLAIHRYLKQAYPYNDDLAYRWMKTQNADFQYFTPLQIIDGEGFAGLLRIRQYLESDQEC